MYFWPAARLILPFIIFTAVFLGYLIPPVVAGLPATMLNKTYASDSPYALVIIRYPAKVEEKATAKFRERCMATWTKAINSSGYRPRTIGSLEDANDQLITELLTKTLYYVEEFYSILSKRLPANSVLLQPEVITLNETGELLISPINSLPPAVITIDFWTRTNFYRMAEGKLWPIDTFANRISPSVTIYRAQKSPISGRRAVAGLPYPNGDGEVGGVLNYYHGGYPRKDIRHDNVKILKKRPAQINTFYEFSGYDQMGDYKNVDLALQNKPGGNIALTPFTHVWETHSDIVIDLLNELDFEQETRAQLLSYVRNFDSNLKSDSVPESALSLIRQFITSEREFLNEQDQHLVKTIYQGEFGNAMRQVVNGEIEYSNKIKMAANRQLVAAIVIGGLAGASHNLVSNNPLAFQTVAQTLFKAVSNISAIESETSRSLKVSLDNHMAGIWGAQKTITINTANGVKEIQGHSLQQLRNEFKSTYLETMELSQAEQVFVQ